MLYPRTIKSFTLRQGRLTNRQENAIHAEGAHYLLATDTMADWRQSFGRDAPLTLEIGFGMGHALLKNATAYPEQNFIGIEVYRPAVGALLAELKTSAIHNVRVFYKDAVDVLTHCIPNQSLDAVHIFFPDPWPKRRHHKRRLIQTPFMTLIVQKLKIGGKLHLATDWEDYATHMHHVLSCEPQLVLATDHAISHHRPLTKYEQRGQRLGHAVWDFVSHSRLPLESLKQRVSCDSYSSQKDS